MRITRQVERAMSGSVATPVIIKTQPNSLQDLRQRLLFDFKMQSLQIPRFNLLAAVLPNEVIDEVKQLPFVETIYFDQILRIPEIKGANVSFEPVQRLLLKMAEVRARKAVFSKPEWVPTSVSRTMLEADKAELEGFQGEGVKIAVVDTDASARYENHPQLMGRVKGFRVIEEATDKNGHGGHVSTTAFGGAVYSRLSRLRAVGVAPKASGIGIKVLRGAAGMGNTSDVIKGIEFAVNQGVDVINLSLGGPPTKDPSEDPMFQVFEQIKDKIIACVAIGNEGPDEGTTSSPGSLPNVLSVGAVDIHGDIAQFSSRGPTPDGRIKPEVVAPGVNIWSGTTSETYLDYVSDFLGNGFTALSGTSMATPHVAGLMALVIQLFRKKSPAVQLTTDLVLKICGMFGDAKDNTGGWGLIQYSWFREYINLHG